MGLAGTGAVAIWHDIAPEGRAEFYAWHGRQHMPERAGIPGFLRGRRFIAVHGEPEFFNLYETSSPAVVSGPEYLARLNAPTPWTAATVRHFRGVARALCEVAATAGEGQGGLIATFRYAVPDTGAALHRTRVAASVVPATAALPGIAGCHLLVADPVASAIETAEKKARGGPSEIPRWIVLVEGWGDAPAFIEWCATFAAGTAFSGAAGPPVWAAYQLQNSRDAPAPQPRGQVGASNA